jgi:dUTPase
MGTQQSTLSIRIIEKKMDKNIKYQLINIEKNKLTVNAFSRLLQIKIQVIFVL